MDKLANRIMLDALEEQGDARAAWQAVAFCTENRVPFPAWVTSYLGRVATRVEDHLVNRDERHPLQLMRVFGFDQLNRPDRFDFDRDPEVIFERITTWITEGEVRSVTAGAARYHAEVLKGFGSPGTVREAFYRGKSLASAPPLSR